MLQMLNFENPNQNQINSPPEISLNYRDRPPQTAHGTYRPNNNNNNNNNPIHHHQNSQNLNIENNLNIGGINLPRVQRSQIKRNNLNMSSDNIEQDDLGDFHGDDGMQPKV